MKKIVIVLLVLASSFSLAQDSYFGLGISVFTDLSHFAGLPSLQFGTTVADSTEIRISLDSIVFISLISLDLLYSEEIPQESTRFYLGGGVDFTHIAILGKFGSGVELSDSIHLLAGYEYLFDDLGVFAELQPTLAYNANASVRIRFGANIHF